MKQYTVCKLMKQDSLLAKQVCDGLVKHFSETLPSSLFTFGVAQDSEKNLVVDLTCEVRVPVELLSEVRHFAVGFETALKDFSFLIRHEVLHQLAGITSRRGKPLRELTDEMINEEISKVLSGG